ncbi:hypothetical protein HWC08_gp131 [Lactobacillus phage 521B]|uniref:Uncharacterized protein n=2 Tax=Tybeckvirus TaxID=2843105 RepID=A0A4Y5FF62_9CAUD|nr:hypothetical protein HWC08_gp131 [Lactobacillus phage 521B]YP_009844314.1 hypothetical protein HWC10_gp142 [Lactobacillus phage SAC12B]QBJ03510.1 hypothetical protein B521_0160 [Lactobacillus phage 521B]QBJ03948.1 hypothetical protein SAC12B_0159 [Lactobacillus phage SAC12B]
MKLNKYIELMQEASNKLDSEKMEELDKSHGDEVVTYREAEQSIAETVDALLRYSANIKSIEVGQFEILVGLLEKHKLVTQEEINNIRKAHHDMIKAANEELLSTEKGGK